MAVRFNHTIAHSRDKRASASFLAEILGLAPPRDFGHVLELITRPYGSGATGER